MNILNVHKRRLYTSPEDAWRLIANLGSKHELLWPHGWPGIRFDRPLGLGATGNHGPISYYVEEYSPPELIRFRVTHPKGFDGYHEFRDRKSTRLNSSHVRISYAVFCLKK